jgi:hypothetical protein
MRTENLSKSRDSGISVKQNRNNWGVCVHGYFSQFDVNQKYRILFCFVLTFKVFNKIEEFSPTTVYLSTQN